MKTESFDSRFKGLDLWEDSRILEMILDSQEAAVFAVGHALPAIERAAAAAAARLKKSKSGRLIYAGAGTSARLSVQDGSELTPTYGWPADRLAFAIAGGEKALLKAVENAEDDPGAARRDIEDLQTGADDVCITVSASGRTPYTVEACCAARELGALTIGISSNDDSLLLKAADYPIFVDSGAEPVGGSTRMNAGTVQKIILNMISTLVMIRLGRVYDGMMVDVELNNAKLRDRAVRMLCEITGTDEEKAAAALAEAKGHVKLAVLLVNGAPLDRALSLLDDHDGDLRTALEVLGS